VAKTKEIEIAVADVVDYMRMTGSFSPALKEVVSRKITMQAARDKGIRATTGEIQRAADVFRYAQGLTGAKDTENWLKANGITLNAFEEYIETNLLISKFKAHLAKKGSTSKILASPEIKETVKEMVYQGWLGTALK